MFILSFYGPIKDLQKNGKYHWHKKCNESPFQDWGTQFYNIQYSFPCLPSQRNCVFSLICFTEAQACRKSQLSLYFLCSLVKLQSNLPLWGGSSNFSPDQLPTRYFFIPVQDDDDDDKSVLYMGVIRSK